jgi:hypothetical protein
VTPATVSAVVEMLRCEVDMAGEKDSGMITWKRRACRHRRLLAPSMRFARLLQSAAVGSAFLPTIVPRPAFNLTTMNFTGRAQSGGLPKHLEDAFIKVSFEELKERLPKSEDAETAYSNWMENG